MTVNTGKSPHRCRKDMKQQKFDPTDVLRIPCAKHMCKDEVFEKMETKWTPRRDS